MELNNFTEYTAEDFILNDSFQAYVLESNAAEQEFWRTWILNHPEKEEEIIQATALVKALGKPVLGLSEEVKEQELNKLLARLEAEETEAKIIPFQTQPQSITYSWRLLAATLTGLLILATGIFFNISNKKDTLTQYQTAFGEIKEIVLPDNSKVILNSNSRLTYAGNWNEKKPRAVWVSGEAFFSVTHTKNNQKFTVTTSTGNTIEVLGTQFNVSDRRYKNSVVLKSGKITLALKPESKLKSPPMFMTPGELIEVKADGPAIIRKKVDPDMYTSWRENVLVFDNTTLAEISAQFQEGYGVSVVIAHEKLANLKVSGVASTLDLEGFLAGLAKLHKFRIRKTNNKLYLELNSAENQV
jgi:ferric-dicitrate binding protein FerR (iron transport regulator)